MGQVAWHAGSAVRSLALAQVPVKSPWTNSRARALRRSPARGGSVNACSRLSIAVCSAAAHVVGTAGLPSASSLRRHLMALVVAPLHSVEAVRRHSAGNGTRAVALCGQEVRTASTIASATVTAIVGDDDDVGDVIL